MLKEAAKNIQNIQSPRAKAYAIVGLSFITDSEEMLKHIEILAMSLVDQYKIYKDGNWHWIHSKGSARYNPAGEIIRWYGTIEDIAAPTTA